MAKYESDLAALRAIVRGVVLDYLTPDGAPGGFEGGGGGGGGGGGARGAVSGGIGAGGGGGINSGSSGGVGGSGGGGGGGRIGGGGGLPHGHVTNDDVVHGLSAMSSSPASLGRHHPHPHSIAGPGRQHFPPSPPGLSPAAHQQHPGGSTAGGGGSTVAGPSTRAALLSVGGAYSCSECS